MDNEIRIGDPVFIINSQGKPYRKCPVLDIKLYKKNVKITAWNDEWDAVSGNPWSERGKKSYFGPRLVRHSESIQLEYDEVFMHANAVECLRLWEELTPNQKMQFGKMAGDILSTKIKGFENEI